MVRYKGIIQDLGMLLDGYEYDLLDHSFMLSEDEFFNMHNGFVEAANYRGRLKLLELFEKANILDV